MFTNNTEQFKLETEKALEKTLEVVKASFDGVEKLARMQLESSRKLLEETTATLKNLSGTTDPKEIVAKVTESTNAAIERNVASAKDVYAIVSEVSTKVNQIAENNLATAQKAALDAVNEFAKFNPTGSKVAADAVNTWISNTNQAIAVANKVASQVTAFANKNIETATETTKNFANKVAGK